CLNAGSRGACEGPPPSVQGSPRPERSAAWWRTTLGVWGSWVRIPPLRPVSSPHFFPDKFLASQRCCAARARIAFNAAKSGRLPVGGLARRSGSGLMAHHETFHLFRTCRCCRLHFAGGRFARRCCEGPSG